MISKQVDSPGYQDLVEAAIRQPLTEEDALLWMVLLHTHQVQVNTSDTNNGLRTKTLAPQTQRGAAEIIAHLWPDRSGERASYHYWYSSYNTKTPFEDLSQVPAELLPRLLELRGHLSRDPRVRAVVEDN